LCFMRISRRRPWITIPRGATRRRGVETWVNGDG